MIIIQYIRTRNIAGSFTDSLIDDIYVEDELTKPDHNQHNHLTYHHYWFQHHLQRGFPTTNNDAPAAFICSNVKRWLLTA